MNQNPKCEPQLGKRGLYRQTGGHAESKEAELALLWVLNFSDGTHSLLDIAERAGLSFGLIDAAARSLYEAGLLKECEWESRRKFAITQVTTEPVNGK